jgi:hypothetical protein
MDKVYQVFVSSTFSDLEDERKAVSDTLAKAGFIPSGMELFPATDQLQLEFIKRIIDRCDYYVVIVAARYGSLDGEKSFTEKEYEYAMSRKIPVLAFLHKDPGKIAAERVETDKNQIERLELFRTRLKASRIVSFWTSISDLRTEVLTAVTNAANLAPGTGWIRGDQGIDPKLLQELERLRIENSELRRDLEEFTSEELIHFPLGLLGPDDEMGFALEAYNKDTKKRETIIVKAVLGEVFVGLFDTILLEPNEFTLALEIGALISYLTNQPHDNFHYRSIEVTRLRYHLAALGLINATGKTGMSGYGEPTSEIVWTITEKGRRFAAMAQALRKPDAGKKPGS